MLDVSEVRHQLKAILQGGPDSVRDRIMFSGQLYHQDGLILSDGLFNFVHSVGGTFFFVHPKVAEALTQAE